MKRLSDTLLRRNTLSLGQGGFYQKVTHGALYALFFLMPLFLLPLTSNILEINKQTLLVILTFIALLSWLGSMVVEKRLIFRSGFLNLLPLLFLLTVLISSIFSIGNYQSWVGQRSAEYTSFLSIASFILLFYVLMNNAADKSVHRNLFFAILLSGSLAGLITVLSLFKLYLLPFSFARTIGFSTVGSLNSMVIYMTVVMLIGIGIWFVSNEEEKDDILPAGKSGKFARVLIIANLIMTMLLLLTVDYWVLWILNIFGIIILFAFAFVQQKEFFAKSTRFSLGFVILLISILMLFMRSPIRFSITPNISLSYRTSWSIAAQTIKESPVRFLFGSGPGTFVYDFAKYRPDTLTNTRFWATPFNQSKSYILTALATLGVASILFLLVIMLVVGLKTISRLLREREHEQWKFMYVLGAAWFTMALAFLMSSSNISLQFLFWGLTGLLGSQIFSEVKETNFSKSPKLGFLFSFFFIFMAVGVITTLFISAKRYAADLSYAEAVGLNRTGAPIEQVITKLGEAISYNSLSDIYYRNLGYALLIRLRNLLQLPEGQTQFTPEQNRGIQQLVIASANSVGRASRLEPYNAQNWSLQGLIYRELMSLVRDADKSAIAAFEKAQELEPWNPTYQVNSGRVNLITADRARANKNSQDKIIAEQAADTEQKALTAAEGLLLKGTELKNDYAPGHYYLAAVYERQKKIPEAIVRLETVRNSAPLDIGIGFQLATLYVRNKNTDQAQSELERIIGLRENYSNARWLLAAIYEEKGQRDKAIEQLEKVVELNPDNKAVAQRLSDLKSGKKTKRSTGTIEEGEELKENVGEEETAPIGEEVEEL